MNYQRVDDYSVVPPGWFWFVLVFLVAAVLVVRSRPAWLLYFWLGACLLAAAGMLSWRASTSLYHAPVHTFAEFVLTHGIPGGLVILWLHRTRRHRMLSRAPVQLLGALAVFVGGLMIVLTITEILVTKLSW